MESRLTLIVAALALGLIGLAATNAAAQSQCGSIRSSPGYRLCIGQGKMTQSGTLASQNMYDNDVSEAGIFYDCREISDIVKSCPSPQASRQPSQPASRANRPASGFVDVEPSGDNPASWGGTPTHSQSRSRPQQQEARGERRSCHAGPVIPVTCQWERANAKSDILNFMCTNPNSAQVSIQVCDTQNSSITKAGKCLWRQIDSGRHQMGQWFKEVREVRQTECR